MSYEIIPTIVHQFFIDDKLKTISSEILIKTLAQIIISRNIS
jgi:hypothetical protein